MTHDMMRILR